MFDTATYLRTSQAAKHLQVSESLLEKLRLTGKGPVFFRLPGGRAIFYRKSDLDHWITSRAHKSTSEAA